MRSQNTKVNGVGKASCLLLILLTFLAINPAGSSAYAEELTNNGEDVVSDEGFSTQADTPSTVSISFAPSSGSASLSPTTSAGQSAQINVLATVSVQNSGGYSVYIKSNTQNLVGKNSSANVIPGISGAVTYDNLATNTWGYSANEGAAVPEGATYKAISVTGNGDKIAENASSKIYSDTKQVMLSFATKIGTDMPADTYQNTVTMSVVSSPLQTTLTDISEMQSMSTSICDASSMYETNQLKDARDGKYYWVSKLADGKCWMTQNLDLDLATNKPLTSADSDVTSNYTPAYNTATTATSSTIENVATAQRSWSLGNYRITNPNTSSDCGSGKNSAADCPTQFTAYTTPTSQDGDVNAHYILGNHYQWNTATAGTGGSITSGTASSSICPKGWRLPTSNTGGEFEKLVTALGGASSTNNVTQAPFYGVRGGYVNQDTTYLFYYAGDYGLYWSSTPNSNGTSAYNLDFNTNGINPSNYSSRQDGRSVRCVAR